MVLVTDEVQNDRRSNSAFNKEQRAQRDMVKFQLQMAHVGLFIAIVVWVVAITGGIQ